MLEVQTERVLVVPTELFRSLGYFQGFSSNIDRYLNHLFDPRKSVIDPGPRWSTTLASNS